MGCSRWRFETAFSLPRISNTFNNLRQNASLNFWVKTDQASTYIAGAYRWHPIIRCLWNIARAHYNQGGQIAQRRGIGRALPVSTKRRHVQSRWGCDWSSAARYGESLADMNFGLLESDHADLWMDGLEVDCP